MTLVEALALLPDGYFLRIETGRRASGGAFITSTLFRADAGPVVMIGGVSAEVGDFEAFEQATVKMLVAQFDPEAEVCPLPSRTP